jgi:TonB family protein
MDYPQLAVQARMRGEILVDCTLNSSGQVVDERVVESVGMGGQARLVLGRAVVENVREWRFQRAPGSASAALQVRLRYTFTLDNETRAKRTTRFIFEYPDHVYVISSSMSL